MRRTIFQILRRLWREQTGQDMIEYVLLLLLVVLGAISSTKRVSNTIKNTYSNMGSTVTNKTKSNNGGNNNGGDDGGHNNIGGDGGHNND